MGKDQPRIPKGFVGAGRFMKVGQVLTAVKDAAHPGDGRRSREPRLAKAGAKLTGPSVEQRQAMDVVRQTRSAERGRLDAEATAIRSGRTGPQLTQDQTAMDRLRKIEARQADIQQEIRAAAKTAAPTAHDHSRALEAMGTREEAHAYLANVKGKELDALARHYSVQHRRTAADRRKAIVEHTVGGRLDSAAIARGTSTFTEDQAATPRKHPASPDHSAAHSTIRESVARHANESGWATVADVRDDLAASGITDRAEQDAALRSMLDQPYVRIVPVADTKNLKARERDGALWIGGEPNPGIRVTPERGQSADYQWRSGGSPSASKPGSLSKAATRLAETGKPNADRAAAQDELDRAILRYEDLYGTDRDEWPGSARSTLIALEARGAKERPRHPATPEGIADAFYEAMKGEDTNGWLSLVDLRPRLGGTREEQDHALLHAALARDIHLIPEEIQKSIRQVDRDAAVRIGGEDKHLVAIHGNSRLHRGSGGTHTDAQVEQRIADAYARLNTNSDGLVSLARLRADLADIERHQLDRVLKALDRQRRLQLEPDVNRKALPREAREAAVQLGGEDKHFVVFTGTPTQSGGPSTADRRPSASPRLAKVGAKLGPPLTAEVAAKLRAATSRQEAAGYLTGLNLSKADMAKLARSLDLPPKSSDSKAAIQASLVSILVGRRLDGEAIYRVAGGR